MVTLSLKNNALNYFSDVPLSLILLYGKNNGACIPCPALQETHTHAHTHAYPLASVLALLACYNGLMCMLPLTKVAVHALRNGTVGHQ